MKRLSKWAIIQIMVLSYSINGFSQDTVSVYFKINNFKIEQKQSAILNLIPVNFDLSDLDSLYYLGMTDSTGNLNSNLRLSEKRAKNVAKYCRTLISHDIPYSIKVIGETYNKKLSTNRRVDIILFFNPIPIKIIDKVDSNRYCYYIDYDLLHRSHIRTIIKRRKKYVFIETSFVKKKRLKKYYHASLNKQGEIVTQEIYWRKRKTGHLWWSKIRLVTKIPKENFDKFKIFTKEVPPCNDCDEAFELDPKVKNVVPCIQLDWFLMRNIQCKNIFFNTNFVKIRAPREYVNLDYKYYVGCNLRKELIWETKKGRKRRNYYFTRLPSYLNSISSITRFMTCCDSNLGRSLCDPKFAFGKPDGTLMNKDCIGIGLEIGDNYFIKLNKPYIGVGIRKAIKESQLTFQIGTDIDLSLYNSLKLQRNLISFPTSALNPAPKWRSPGSLNAKNRDINLYLGTEIRSSIVNSELNYLEQNLHLGISTTKIFRYTFLSEIFVQYGIAYDYTGSNSLKVYSIGQAGINMYLMGICEILRKKHPASIRGLQ